MYIEDISDTKEGKLLKVAIARLSQLYKDKSFYEILNMLEKAAEQYRT